MDFGLSSAATQHYLMLNVPPKKQRQLISQGLIAKVVQTEAYGRWLYTTIHGQSFLSTINPAYNHLLPGNGSH